MRDHPRQEPGAVIPPAGIRAGGGEQIAVPTATAISRVIVTLPRLHRDNRTQTRYYPPISTMRLFTALELPPPICDHLARAIDSIRPPLKGVASFTRPENLHVTLKFFGELPDPQVPRLLTALQSLKLTPMRFTVERFICLPPNGTTRVLAANLAGDIKPLADLFTQTESACAPMGIAREHRPYRPHITLARFKSPPSRHTPNSLVKLIDPSLLPTAEFIVEGFVLMQSDLKPTGPVYTPLARFPRRDEDDAGSAVPNLRDDRA